MVHLYFSRFFSPHLQFFLFFFQLLICLLCSRRWVVLGDISFVFAILLSLPSCIAFSVPFQCSLLFTGALQTFLFTVYFLFFYAISIIPFFGFSNFVHHTQSYVYFLYSILHFFLHLSYIQTLTQDPYCTWTLTLSPSPL